MKLPKINSLGSAEECLVLPKGIDRENRSADCLYDALNLTFDGGCKTRNSRNAVMFLEFVPDQIIVIDGRLFLRSENTLMEAELLNDGTPCGIKSSYELKNLEDKPDREIITMGTDLCILPDELRITQNEERWDFFGIGNSVSAALPFKNSRTLYYTSGLDGREHCNDCAKITLGTKFRFNWLPAKIFTVVKYEEVTSKSSDGASNLFQGINICLDSPVDGWNSLAADSAAEIMQPNTLPLVNSLHLGIDKEVYFSTNGLFFECLDSTKTCTPFIDTFIHIGQKLQISGSSVASNNKIVTVSNYRNGHIVFNETLTSVDEPIGTEVILKPIIPNFEHMIFTDGRIFGADNSNRKFWISSPVNPFWFYEAPFTEDSAWYSDLNADVTAITKFGQSIICFFAKGAFKLMGDTALNFSLLQIPISGIANGKGNSLVQIGDTLFYCSNYGIMKYSAGSDKKISGSLKETPNVSAAAASKGKYYIKAQSRLWIYDHSLNKWWSYSADSIDGIFEINDNIFLVSDNVIYSAFGENFSFDWNLTTAELPVNFSGGIHPLSLSAELKSKNGAEVAFYIKHRGEQDFTKLLVKLIKGEEHVILPLKKFLSRGLTVKLTGNGDCEIENITLKFRRKK